MKTNIFFANRLKTIEWRLISAYSVFCLHSLVIEKNSQVPGDWHFQFEWCREICAYVWFTLVKNLNYWRRIRMSMIHFTCFLYELHILLNKNSI